LTHGPPAVEGVTLGAAGTDRNHIAWGSVTPSNGYDVVAGRLSVLRQRHGNYTLAVDTCVANDLVATALDDSRIPIPSTAFFYLVRALNCGMPGSYDEPGAVATRDAGIQGSPAHCP